MGNWSCLKLRNSIEKIAVYICMYVHTYVQKHTYVRRYVYTQCHVIKNLVQPAVTHVCAQAPGAGRETWVTAG